MPFVTGFLRVRRRKPGGGGPTDPDYGIEGPIDPDYGIDAGEIGGPDEPPPRPQPTPPPGIWPPLTPDRPVDPLPPVSPEHPIAPPPGVLWPPVNATGKRIALVWISGIGYKYTVFDLDAQWPPGKPEQPLPPGAQPKR